MKIQILSDLHLEFRDYQPVETDADVVVLAGDVHTKARGVAWALKNFTKPVVYICGNHEYYGGSLGRTLQKMKAEAAGTHVHVLHDEAVTLAGIRFLGGTLWTDYRLTGNEPLAQWDAQQRLNDFKKVRDEQYRKVRPYQMSARHMRTRNFLMDRLAEPFEGPTVVVTHHAPCELSIHPRYHDSGDHLNASYASRLDQMMGPPIDLWIHGHTHDSWDYDMHGTRVLCNPRGYAPSHLNEGFVDNLVIDLSAPRPAREDVVQESPLDDR